MRALQDLYEKLMSNAYDIGLDPDSPPPHYHGGRYCSAPYPEDLTCNPNALNRMAGEKLRVYMFDDIRKQPAPVQLNNMSSQSFNGPDFLNS